MVTNIEHLSKPSNYSTQERHAEGIGSSFKGFLLGYVYVSILSTMCVSILLAMYVSIVLMKMGFLVNKTE